MLTEHIDASKAAFEVDYKSSSQFSREYGAPPMKDIKKPGPEFGELVVQPAIIRSSAHANYQHND